MFLRDLSVILRDGIKDCAAKPRKARPAKNGPCPRITGALIVEPGRSWRAVFTDPGRNRQNPARQPDATPRKVVGVGLTYFHVKSDVQKRITTVRGRLQGVELRIAVASCIAKNNKMTVSYHYDPKQRLLIVQASGDVSMDERLKCMSELLCDSELPDSCPVLIDCSDATRTANELETSRIAFLVTQLHQRFKERVSILSGNRREVMSSDVHRINSKF